MLRTRFWFSFALLALVVSSGTVMGQFEERTKRREKEEADQKRPKTYEEKWTLDPANEDPRWKRANELYRTGHYDETLKLFLSFLAEDPNEVSVVCSMASMHWDRGEYVLAEKWYDEALKLVPKHVEAKKFKARMFYQMGRWKESEELFKELIQVKGLRGDILGSSRLNLGKIALLRRNFREASKWFWEAAKSPRKGHRSQAEKGRFNVVRFKRTRMWNSMETAGLKIFFSPRIADAADRSVREAWANDRQQALDRILKTLGMSFTQKMPLYVFKDDGDSFEVTNQKLPSWKYSWWIMATGWKRPPGYDMALQMVARVRGYRPPSKPMVTGLAAYACGSLGDPHRAARQFLRQKKLRGFAEVHVSQVYELDEALLYGQSFVAWLIDTYGMDKFLKSFAEYKLVRLDPRYKSTATGRITWTELLSEAFRRGIKEDLPTLEKRWKSFLRG